MRFRAQLVSGLAALVALIALAATTGLFALHATGARTHGLVDEYVRDLAGVQELRVRAERMIASSRGFLLSGDAALHAEFVSDRGELQRALAALPVEDPDAAKVVQLARDYERETSRVVDERARASDSASILPEFEHALRPRHDGLEAGIAAFTRGRGDRFAASLREVDTQARHAQVALLVASLLAMACGILLALIVSRRLARQFRELRETEAAAQRAAAAREEVLSVVSHDLRSPLQAISMGATLVAESTAEESTRRFVHTIDNAAGRMKHMIDELMEAARLEHHAIDLRRTRLDRRALVDDAVDLARAAGRGRGIEIVGEAGERSGAGGDLDADRERVLAVLGNLIGNAIKYAPAGTQITVRAEAVTGGTQFSVSDRGPGIPPEQIPKLFDRFWQADRRKRDGLGLGLYICKRLVDAHGGTIGCDSALGQGTTFWFRLPSTVAGSGAAAKSGDPIGT